MADSIPNSAQRMGADEHTARHGKLSNVDYARMRQEGDEFFGTEDRLDDDDPWVGGRG